VRETAACKPWLAAELRLIEPEVVVALGATASRSLLGSGFRVTKQRGIALPMPPLDGDGGEVSGAALVATIHPSAVLRADGADRAEVYAGLVSDLKVAARLLNGAERQVR
jgi:uracil-DNA glycosylase